MAEHNLADELTPDRKMIDEKGKAIRVVEDMVATQFADDDTISPVETTFYVVRMEDGVYGETTEKQAVDNSGGDPEYYIVEVTNGDWDMTIEIDQWYFSNGICKLIVNHFDIPTALSAFNEMVKCFDKAEKAINADEAACEAEENAREARMLAEQL